ncbi:tetratricopeptide repeat protein [Massilia sp. SM-13]|uniref:tetratricopeptide repeat protein n=1 Tax=Pseudoduganella rhizocola TaxID=3382643 RepID=UPI0038B46F94
MSLINKMLQDLDARQGGEAARQGGSPVVRPVASGGERWPRPGLALAAGVGVVVLALGGVLAWRYLFSKPPVAAGAVPAQAAAPAAKPAVVIVPSNPVTPPEDAKPAKPEPGTLAANEAAAAKSGAVRDAEAGARPAAAAKQSRAAQRSGETARSEAAVAAAPRTPRARAGDTAAAARPQQDDVGSQQRGETLYRRGLAALQEGRVNEALASLEQAVLYYPRHDAARQTLIGLLIENRRTDEAIRHLQFGIGLDPRQVNMAMLLARLQLERGGAAVDTLQRSLPYAGNNAEYRAFLAGALQHDQRHREAVEQYQAALRLQPHNGVWWMGLGISLQADKRNAEARDAFTRARATGALNPELQVFVERKLQQLN